MSNVGIAAGRVLPALRDQAESMMVDAWRVTRPAPREFDAESGNYTANDAVIYEGPGKLQTTDVIESDPQSSGHEFTVLRSTLHLPIDGSEGIRVGDVAQCTAAGYDAALIGARVRITSVPVKSMATARRLPVERILT